MHGLAFGVYSRPKGIGIGVALAPGMGYRKQVLHFQRINKVHERASEQTRRTQHILRALRNFVSKPLKTHYLKQQRDLSHLSVCLSGVGGAYVVDWVSWSVCQALPIYFWSSVKGGMDYPLALQRCTRRRRGGGGLAGHLFSLSLVRYHHHHHHLPATYFRWIPSWLVNTKFWKLGL